MGLIMWDASKHSVNVQNFDSDHKKMFDLINELYNKMSAGQGVTVISGVLKEVKKWAYTHMDAEEELMKRYSFPDSETHKQEHAFFKTKVDKFNASIKAGNTQISVETFFFLKDWLNNHILETDKKYVEFFHNKGIH